MFMLALAYCYL